MSQPVIQPYHRPYGRNFGAMQNLGQKARLTGGTILPVGVPPATQRVRTYRPGNAVQAPAAAGTAAAKTVSKAGGGCGG